MRKTKIVCTLGPAVDEYKSLIKLFNAGMNVARFNFSHGDYEQQSKRIEMFKAVRTELGANIPAMLDTKGPEIRIGTFENKKITLHEGNYFTLKNSNCIGNENEVYVNYPLLSEDVNIGSKILINDGLIELEVTEIINKDVKCKILNGGTLTDRKSVNVPGLVLNLPLLTKKDEEDIIFGIENGFDIIAVSFVRKPEDILAIRNILEKHNAAHIKLIAKIENHEGVQNFDKILEVVDGIMVARGDLGVEIPIYKVPILQKEFVKKCNEKSKTVIIATQMLESMITNPRPTRAEVSDVANAVFENASAIMLSGETAMGEHPSECVKTMGKIAEEIENSIDYWKTFESKKHSNLIGKQKSLIIGHSLCEVAMHTNAKAIISLSTGGNTPTDISGFRPNCPIYAITYNEHTARQLNLIWGTYPILVNKSSTSEEMIQEGIEKLKELELIKPGDTVIISGSDTHGSKAIPNLSSNRTIGGIYIV